MRMNLDPTIFDSLNARQLTPFQIAQSFIPPEGFFELVKRNSNILIGPRGSGKTTLLKMLQLPALLTWQHERSDEITQNIDYISAFVSTDRAWESQWLMINNLQVHPNIQTHIKKAIFTAHTLRQVIEAFKFCTTDYLLEHPNLSKFHIHLSKQEEAILVKEIADFLLLKVDIPSFDFVMLQLKKRLSIIGEFIYKNLHKVEVIDEKEIETFIYFDFMHSITTVIEILNSSFADKNQKWALLFDELEIAPADIRKELFNFLRSTDDQRIIFKLSISPYAQDLNLSNTSGSYAGHDYVPINLTYSRKERARPFCEGLFNQMCRFYGLEHLSAGKVFGISEFDRGNEEKAKEQSAYGVNSALYCRFKSLAEKDKSFRNYLERKNINLEQMESMTEKERASKVRKVTNLVCIRDTFLNEKQGIRSVKKTKLYTGFKTLFDITEGNPRLFLAIVGPLLKKYVHTGRPISESDQADIVTIAIDRFRALLSTIPAPDGYPQKMGASLISLIDYIGESFQKNILREDFNADPATSFTVDNNTHEKIKELLGMALNAGAIIYIHESEETPLLDSLTGKKFRLSHLLAPYFRLPLIVNKSQNLSTILGLASESEIQSPKGQGSFTFD